MKVYELLTLYNNKRKITVIFSNWDKKILPMGRVEYKLEDVPFELIKYDVKNFTYFKNWKELKIYI